MELLLNIIQAILGFGFSVIGILVHVIIAFIVGGIAYFKGRSFLLWGFATYFFPWIFFVIIFFPRKYPKFKSYLKEKEEFKGKNPVIASIMALSAVVAKADGSVSREEIALIKKFISSNFNISSEELNEYGDVFDYGKNHPDEYKEFTKVIVTFYRSKDTVIAIAYLLIAISMEDGGMTEAEDNQIRDIVFEMGLSEYEYNGIKNSFVQSRTYYGNENDTGFGQNKENLIKKYCEILGVDNQASMVEIKKAYRKLVKEHHPDKIASKGMPEEYMKYANSKIAELNEAYEYLKKVKEA